MHSASLVLIFLVKVCLEKWRHPIRNLLNTLFPIVVIGLYVFARSGYQRGGAEKSARDVPAVLSEALSQDDLVELFPTGFDSKLFYAPKDEFTEQLIEQVRQKLFITYDRVEAFPSSADMEHTLLVSQDFYAIEFGRNSSEAHLSYTIRSKNNNFRTGEVYSRNVYSSYLKDNNAYFESGFLALQFAIEKSFIEIRTGLADQSLPEFNYEHIPLGGPSPQESSEIYTVNVMLAVFISVACTYLLLVPLVEEKASGIKEYLKIATAYSYWNDVAIFMTNFIHLGTIALVCMIITNVAAVWEATAAQLVFAYLFLFLFVICTIAFTFFISTLLESVTISTIIAPICYFAPVIFAWAQKGFEPFLMIFPMAGFNVGVSILHDYQNSWHSFRTIDAFLTGYPGNGRVSFIGAMLMLMFGSCLWTFLWFYISNVRPGRYGTPKPLGFFLNKQYYQKGKNKIKHKHIHDHSSLTEEGGTGNNAAMEDGGHLEKVVKISNLNKLFKTASGTRMAVKDLSLKIYKNRITALLGHNGAGKTTTMNIITGMTPRTSGRIEIDGEDNPSNYRQQIGFCPQHNVALAYMTCQEHLIFFGVLRGMTKEESKRKADEILEKVNLKDKSDQVLSRLSGGMKRRLCLANAIIGRTKLLILDEPTSGLDPESRRDVWDILLKLKKDHTILITTHFMEEADVLGDWIAIMENGELIAFGTSLFLKHHYGKGYTLKLLKDEHFERDNLMAIIKEFNIEGAIEKPAMEPIFAVTLPFICIEQYAGLLKDLEDNKTKYGIVSISVSNATLEEVFLNSSSNNKALEQQSIDIPDGRIEPRSASTSTQSKPQENICQKLQLPFVHQFKAILYKKFIHAKRNLHIYGFMSALPIITTLICFLASSGYSRTDYNSIALHHSTVDRAFAVIVLNDVDRPINISTIKNGSYFKDLDLIVLEDRNIEDFLHQEAKKDWTRYYDRLVAAVEYNVSDRTLKMLHNNNLLHSAGIAANIGSNLLLHYYGYPQADVAVQNSPSTRKLQVDSTTPYLFTEAIALAFMLYILQYLQLPFLEKSTGFKQLHNFNRYVYWTSTFLIDITCHLIICLMVVLLALSIDRDNLFSSTEHWQIFGTLLLYGFVALLVIYIISQCVETLDTALTFMSYLMILGVCGVFLLSDGYDRIKENEGLIMLFHLIPEFDLKHSLRVVYENQKLSKIQAILAEHSEGDKAKAIEKLDLVYIYVFAPFMVAVLTVILMEVIENIDRRGAIMEGKEKVLIRLQSYKCRGKQQKGIDQIDSNSQMNALLDDDVDAESKLVETLVTKEPLEFTPYTIAVHSLKKQYLGVPAVQGISFTVKRGECFGLLGMNGAGKTSTFQMITKNLPITDGTIYLNDRNVRQTNESEYRSQFGYCPQGDSLLDFMTPYELINYSAKVKNLPDQENLTHRWLTDLDILEFAHSRISECSGGTKRKVNTVLAMLGNPSIVFLDEPTTGVDPKSKHFVWSRIKELQRRDQTIILTSHSMEECEELCNRLSIMVGGQLRCIGFIQRLKEKYGNGFNLYLKLKSGIEGLSTEQIHEIQDTLDIDASKRRYEEHDGMLKFLVPEPVLLSKLFSQATNIQKTFADHIQTFSINETTLEDVFLNFRPPISDSEIYKTRGRRGLGYEFKRKIVALMFERATLRNYQFKLATNMKQAGKYYGVVMFIENRNEQWFIQTRYKDKGVLTQQMLFPADATSRKSAYFSLYSYLECYLLLRDYGHYGGRIRLHLLTNIKIDKSVLFEDAHVDEILRLPMAQHIRLTPNKGVIEEMVEYVNHDFKALVNGIKKLFNGAGMDKILSNYKPLLVKILDSSNGVIRFSANFSAKHDDIRVRKLYEEIDRSDLVKKSLHISEEIDRFFCDIWSKTNHCPTMVDCETVEQFFADMTLSVSQPDADRLSGIIKNDLQCWMKSWISADEYDRLDQYLLSKPFNDIMDYLKKWEQNKKEAIPLQTSELAEECFETAQKNFNALAGLQTVDLSDRHNLDSSGYSSLSASICSHSDMLRNEAAPRFETYTAGDFGGYGLEFQRNISLLLFERAALSKHNFKLATDMQQAAKFDDVVMYHEKSDEWWFIQTKAKMDVKSVINNDMLFPNDLKSQKKASFSLYKYLESYLLIRDYWPYEGSQKFYLFTNSGIAKGIAQETKLHQLLSIPGAQHFRFANIEARIKKIKKIINSDFKALLDAITKLFNGGGLDSILLNYKSLLVKILHKSKESITFSSCFSPKHEDIRVRNLYKALFSSRIIGKSVPLSKDTAKLWIGRSRLAHWPPIADDKTVKDFFDNLVLSVSVPRADGLAAIIDRELQDWMKTWIQPDLFGKLHRYLLSMPFHQLDEHLRQWGDTRKIRAFQTLAIAEECFASIKAELQKNINNMPLVDFRSETKSPRSVCLESVIEKKSTTRDRNFTSKPSKTHITVDEYYIARKLTRNVIINELVLNNNSRFFVTEHGQSVTFEHVKYSKDIVLISDSKIDFAKLSVNFSAHNVHWLKRTDSGLEWQQSHGTVANLRELRYVRKSAEYFPMKINNISDRVVIIAAEPGMGKSTLLTQVVQELQQLYPTPWIKKIDLVDHAMQFRQWRKNATKIGKLDAMNFLYRTLNCEPFESNTDQSNHIEHANEVNVNNTHGKDLEFEVFLYFYDKGKITLLFDGFDEICPDYKDYVLQLLLIFQCDLDLVDRLWITTRPYNILNELEDTLGTFSYNLKHFDEIDQLMFLEIFWTRSLELQAVNSERLRSFSNLLLKSFSDSLNEKDKTFTGIPLHVKTVATVFQHNFKEFYYSANNDLSPGQKQNLDEKLNLAALLNEFWRIKFDEIFFGEKVRIINKPSLDSVGMVRRQRQDTFEKHQLLAILSLLNEKVQSVLFSTDDKLRSSKLIQEVAVGTEKTGIVYQVIDGKPIFVHRIFAEYFAAGYIWEKLKKVTKDQLSNQEVNRYKSACEIFRTKAEWKSNSEVKFDDAEPKAKLLFLEELTQQSLPSLYRFTEYYQRNGV